MTLTVIVLFDFGNNLFIAEKVKLSKVILILEIFFVVSIYVVPSGINKYAIVIE